MSVCHDAARPFILIDCHLVSTLMGVAFFLGQDSTLLSLTKDSISISSKGLIEGIPKRFWDERKGGHKVPRKAETLADSENRRGVDKDSFILDDNNAFLGNESEVELLQELLASFRFAGSE